MVDFTANKGKARQNSDCDKLTISVNYINNNNFEFAPINHRIHNNMETRYINIYKSAKSES